MGGEYSTVSQMFLLNIKDDLFDKAVIEGCIAISDRFTG